MFAYLPKINPYTCGITNNLAQKQRYHDGQMGILAGKFKKIISLTGERALRYKEGRPNVRAYDSCFYEINSVKGSESILPDDQKQFLKLVLRVTQKYNMNVFVYQGKDRDSATIPVNNNV